MGIKTFQSVWAQGSRKGRIKETALVGSVIMPVAGYYPQWLNGLPTGGGTEWSLHRQTAMSLCLQNLITSQWWHILKGSALINLLSPKRVCLLFQEAEFHQTFCVGTFWENWEQAVQPCFHCRTRAMLWLSRPLLLHHRAVIVLKCLNIFSQHYSVTRVSESMEWESI